MLSAETAIGSHPFEAAATVIRIVAAAEQTGARFMAPVPDATAGGRLNAGLNAGIPKAAVAIADGDERGRAVLCHIRTVATSQLVAARRPRTPVFAFGADGAGYGP